MKSKLNKGLFTSDRPDWETPNDLFNKLNDEFHFTLDVCALPNNTKCKQFYSPISDGLKQNWKGICWMNPPYGKEITNWIEKAHNEAQKGNCTVVALLPARTDTRYFHNFIYGKYEIRFLKGRVKFVGGASAAPFPSMIVIFKK